MLVLFITVPSFAVNHTIKLSWQQVEISEDFAGWNIYGGLTESGDDWHLLKVYYNGPQPWGWYVSDVSFDVPIDKESTLWFTADSEDLTGNKSVKCASVKYIADLLSPNDPFNISITTSPAKISSTYGKSIKNFFNSIWE